MIQANNPKYRVYTALITQVGVGAPTVVVFAPNTIGPIVWTYAAVGDYLGTLAGAFTANKTWHLIDLEGTATPGTIAIFTRNNANVMRLQTFTILAAPVDAQLDNASLEIRVYF